MVWESNLNVVVFSDRRFEFRIIRNIRVWIIETRLYMQIKNIINSMPDQSMVYFNWSSNLQNLHTLQPLSDISFWKNKITERVKIQDLLVHFRWFIPRQIQHVTFCWREVTLPPHAMQRSAMIHVAGRVSVWYRLKEVQDLYRIKLWHMSDFHNELGEMTIQIHGDVIG